MSSVLCLKMSCVIEFSVQFRMFDDCARPWLEDMIAFGLVDVAKLNIPPMMSLTISAG